METAAKVLTVFGLGAIELWAAIPAGFLLQLHPLVTGAAASVGSMAGVLVVAMVGERAREWLIRRYGAERGRGRHGRIHRIWARYGVVGLGLLAPALVGAPIGTALGIVLGAKTASLLFWMATGIALWGIGLTLAGVMGLGVFKTLMH